MRQQDVTYQKQLRKKASASSDKKYFSRTADRTRKENSGNARPMRGGIRL